MTPVLPFRPGFDKSITRLFLLATLMLCGVCRGAEVNFVSWGGAYAASQQKAYIDTWRGGKVNLLEYDGAVDEIVRQVESRDISWDVVDVLPHIARLGCDNGWFERLDRDMFTPADDGTAMDDDIMAVVPNDCVVPLVFWSYVVFYRGDVFDEARPLTIADFFDSDRFPGKRALHTWPNGLIEMALLADGVPIRDIYKKMGDAAAMDRAFALLGRIDDVGFWSQGHEPVSMVEAGEVVMATGFNGRVGHAILVDGSDLVVIPEGQVVEENWAVLMKDAPNAELARQFLVHMSAPQQLARQARYINYGPMRASSLDIIAAGEPWFHNGREIMPHLPNRPDLNRRSIFAQPRWWADNGEAIQERYKDWMEDRL